jgi:hypothetical protein
MPLNGKRAIEALFSDTINDHLDDLAHHYSRAGNADKASEYLGRAAELALGSPPTSRRKTISRPP